MTAVTGPMGRRPHDRVADPADGDAAGAAVGRRRRPLRGVDRRAAPGAGRPDPEPVLIGVAGPTSWCRPTTAAVDGLGLLRVLEQRGHGPVTSSARGVGDRPAGHGYVGTVARRLAEAAFRPPARITPQGAAAVGPTTGDVMVEVEVPGSFRTAEIVHAAAGALTDLGAGPHVAVAVGATRDPGPTARSATAARCSGCATSSELDLPASSEHCARHRSSGRPSLVGRGRPRGRGAMRLLARRLGSTLLVSHLGEVTAPHVDRLAFHPVTAGGTGLSLGAVGHRGRTVLTLRARAADWDADGLEQLLEAVGGRLGSARLPARPLPPGRSVRSVRR